jgi:hypothetical protein
MPIEESSLEEARREPDRGQERHEGEYLAPSEEEVPFHIPRD